MFRGMKYVITRRNALLGVGLAAVGCAGVARRPPAGIQIGNISPDENLALGPDENILVGMAGTSLRHEGSVVGYDKSPIAFLFPGSLPSFFVFEVAGSASAGYKQFAVQYAPATPQSFLVHEHGTTINFTPFAVRVPSGPYRLIGSLSGFVQGDRGAQWSINEHSDPLGFNVPKGRVAYIGRFGLITQIVKYSAAAYREQTRGYTFLPNQPQGDLSFPPPSRKLNETPTYCVISKLTLEPQCSFTSYFYENRPTLDLALLREKFPGLVSTNIEIAALNPAGIKNWTRWPEVLRPLSV
jgi:hypothetical protein